MTDKRPGRPALPEEDRIQHRIPAKFSLKEISELKKKAGIAGLSLYEYSRYSLLNAKVQPRVSPEQLQTYKALSTELRNIGINLNIVAKKASSGLVRNYDADIARFLNDLGGIVTTFKKHLL